MQKNDLSVENRGSVINIGIIAHVDAGKTTLTEQLLYHSGAVLAPGSVDLGTAQTDYMEVERRRGISVRTATTVIHWQGVTINLIDTPGHVDFAAEVERSLQVLDCAVLCLSAVEGVQAQSEQYYQALRRLNCPVILFINKTDRTGADPERVLATVRQLLRLSVLPAGQEDQWLSELAEHDDQLAELWLEGRNADREQLVEALIRQMHDGLTAPYLTGSALLGQGIRELLDLIILTARPPAGDPDGPVAASVFKVEHDPRLGRIAYVRLYSGRLKNRDAVFNATRGTTAKIVQIRKTSGRRASDIGEMAAGDIAAICGLSDVRAGDWLGDTAQVPRSVPVAQPLLQVRLRPVDEQDLSRLVAACEELTAEDPKLDMIWVPGVRQLLLHVTGPIQIEILANLFETRFDLKVGIEPPQIIYRETPVKPAIGFDAYTMPKPCWAIVRFEIEPLPTGSGVIYESRTPDTRIHYRYQGQVEQTIGPALQQGPLGWQVTDLKITLADGEDHPVHTHPLDFATVTPMAIMKGLVAAGTRLLEPILRFWLSIPQADTGRMISRIVTMRGQLDAEPPDDVPDQTDPETRRLLTGRVPAAESMDFPVFVAQVTGGRGILTMTFADYQPCPEGYGESTEYRGINPLDRDKYILYVRGAIQ